MSSGQIILLILNLLLVAALLVAWRLWRQSVPKRRTLSTADAADWQASTAAVAPVAQAPSAPAQTIAAPALPVAPVAQSAVDFADFAPMPDGMNGEISDEDLARLLDSAPATSSVPMSAPIPAPLNPVDDLEDTFDPAVAAGTPDATFHSSISQPPAFDVPNFEAPATPPAPVRNAPLFVDPAPVGSAAAPAASIPPPPLPPVTSRAHNNGAGSSDAVADQVSALLTAPRTDFASAPAITQPVAESAPAPSLFAPSAPAVEPAATGTPDRLRIDVTGRAVADLMRSLATRLGDMGYRSGVDGSGGTGFVRSTGESIQISVSSNEATPASADGKPVPGRADIVVVGGQLQETTEAVLFELLDHGFQLRWAVAGELVLSSFDGALARVNVNPAESA